MSAHAGDGTRPFPLASKRVRRASLLGGLSAAQHVELRNACVTLVRYAGLPYDASTRGGCHAAVVWCYIQGKRSVRATRMIDERGPFTEAQWHAVCKGLGT